MSRDARLTVMTGTVFAIAVGMVLVAFIWTHAAASGSRYTDVSGYRVSDPNDPNDPIEYWPFQTDPNAATLPDLPVTYSIAPGNTPATDLLTAWCYDANGDGDCDVTDEMIFRLASVQIEAYRNLLMSGGFNAECASGICTFTLTTPLTMQGSSYPKLETDRVLFGKTGVSGCLQIRDSDEGDGNTWTKLTVDDGVGTFTSGTCP